LYQKTAIKSSFLPFLTSDVLYRKCKEREKTLEKQLLVVYCIADFISYLIKTGGNAAS